MEKEGQTNVEIDRENKWKGSDSRIKRGFTANEKR